ncbi:segregation/condensation protein A [Gloeocapsopsis dulcis]|uniref:Segregation and condensation protein A n=1 Tax=Gloeocapsopsis dulcis AAB1 = 1H9 TaxID=1433147 RepID=A0A6N8G396_9CHRO|nr:ScpA family protein [Gloeocapsopsis dulcis]MUL38586.1 segregation/condensation protein A [Gloeocapsopsis dulcis AAB1 = 1H9]WNN91146.1 ScpA family protein [Gloeocapsopsis dulcis]
MDAAHLLEKITLLIDLAQKGEIDPWDVQVIDVIDRYLSEVFTADKIAQTATEADLSQSGQAFLSASMLVLFKANTLIELEFQQAELQPTEDDFFPNANETYTRVRLPLEQQLRRRPAALPPQKRRVTLQELITQLQLMANQLQAQQPVSSNHNTRTRKLSSPSRTQLRQALELAHQENLTEVAREIEQFLNSGCHNTQQQEQKSLNLDQLVELWTQMKCSSAIAASSHAPVQERVSVFWALLLLSAQSKVELSQDEFYQEIKIRTITAV